MPQTPIPTLTDFSARASQRRTYTFMLKDNGQPFEFAVHRNGQEAHSFGGYVTLIIPPQDLTREQPARTTVTQTPNGAWVDSFGLGLPRWTLRGTTGWRARRADTGVNGLSSGQQGPPENWVDGYLAFHAFSDLVQTYLDENRARTVQAIQQGRPVQPLLTLEFYDHWDDDVWQVEPDGLPVKRRTERRPLLLDYEFRFTGVRDVKAAGTAVADPTGQELTGTKPPEKLADATETAHAGAQAASDGVKAAAQANATDQQVIDGLLHDAVNGKPLATPATENQWLEDGDLTDGGLTPKADALGTYNNPIKATPQLSALGSFVENVENALGRVKSLKDDLSNVVNNVSTKLATPFETVAGVAKDLRLLAQVAAFGSNYLLLTSRMRGALRVLRTQLRGLTCAIGSILASPSLFIAGLKANLHAFLDLMKLSGCATTFSSLKDLSWKHAAG